MVNFCFWLILLLGVGVRAYFYLLPRDLGADEAHLALNFVHLGYRDLAKPLENFQSAPIFFLWAVETVTRIFGFGEMALRLVPFLFSIFSLPLFYFFVRDLTNKRGLALISFALYACSIALAYYATELKPYTIDVSAYVIIGYLLCSRNVFIQRNRSKLLVLSGCLLLLFSISTVAILCVAALYQLLVRRQQYPAGSNNKTLLKIWGSWAGVFLINFFVFIFHHPYSKGMKAIWSWAFCPINVFSSDCYTFLKMRFDELLFTTLLRFETGYYFPYLLLLLALVAIIAMLRRKEYALLLFTVVPTLLHLALSAVHLYPFFQRFVLYLLPGLILLFSYGAYTLLSFLSQKWHWLLGIPVLAIFLAGTIQPSVSLYAHNREERAIKPMLQYINQHYPHTKVLVVTPYTLYRYYHETGVVHNGNYDAIDWFLKPEEYYKNALAYTRDSNYLLFYSIGDQFDGYGETLQDLTKKELLVRRIKYSIFELAEIRPFSDTSRMHLSAMLDYRKFKDINAVQNGPTRYIPIWNNANLDWELQLDPGEYVLQIVAHGSPADKTFPHLILKQNDKIVEQYFLSGEDRAHELRVRIDSTSGQRFTLQMDNDTMIGQEDRNAFIRSIYFYRPTN